VIAAALWLFSASWFYDGYLLLRDGAYTPRWFGNLTLSTVTYLCAGLLWNLEAKPSGGFTFAFTRPDWPAPPADTRFLPFVWLIIPLVAIAAYILVGFVRWRIPGR